MKTSLIIDLPTLPEEGKPFSGQIEGSIFDLSKDDATSVGPMEYDLWIQRFGGELLLTGRISAAFQFTCAITLKDFRKTLNLDSTAIAVEIGNSSQIDVTDAMREEILLAFPITPRCDEGDVPESCEMDSRYLAVDKSDGNDVSPAPRNESDGQWSALNDLTGLNDQT